MRPTVTIKTIRLAIATAAMRGVDPESARRSLGIDAAQLADPNARVLFGVLERAWTELPELAHDPVFGLHAAEIATTTSFGVIDYAVAQCRDLREVIECIVRYQRLLYDANDIAFAIHGDEVRVSHAFRGSIAIPPHFADFVVGQWVLRGRALIGGHLPLRRVEICRAPPADLAEHRRILAVPFAFYAGRNVLVFDVSALNMPVLRADPALAVVLRRHADDLLAALPDAASVSAKLGRHFVETSSQPLDVTRAAKALGMSTRTLQRRLEEEGTSLKAVVDDVRRVLALSHLADPRYSITDVAFLVGFSETSAFSRAFRRWTGQSPIAWRRTRG